jgi:hypothetical protein
LPCCGAALASAERNGRIFSVPRRRAREPPARGGQEGRPHGAAQQGTGGLRSSLSKARAMASRPPTGLFTANATSACRRVPCRCGFTGCTRRLGSQVHHHTVAGGRSLPVAPRTSSRPVARSGTCKSLPAMQAWRRRSDTSKATRTPSARSLTCSPRSCHGRCRTLEVALSGYDGRGREGLRGP